MTDWLPRLDWPDVYLDDLGTWLLWAAILAIGFCLGYGARSYISRRRRHTSRWRR